MLARSSLLGGPDREKTLPTQIPSHKTPITHVKKGGMLESHKNVAEAVRDELYREEQERLDKNRRKGGQPPGCFLSGQLMTEQVLEHVSFQLAFVLLKPQNLPATMSSGR